jgi:hypothetical protein
VFPFCRSPSQPGQIRPTSLPIPGVLRISSALRDCSPVPVHWEPALMWSGLSPGRRFGYDSDPPSLLLLLSLFIPFTQSLSMSMSNVKRSQQKSRPVGRLLTYTWGLPLAWSCQCHPNHRVLLTKQEHNNDDGKQAWHPMVAGDGPPGGGSE